MQPGTMHCVNMLHHVDCSYARALLQAEEGQGSAYIKVSDEHPDFFDSRIQLSHLVLQGAGRISLNSQGICPRFS